MQNYTPNGLSIPQLKKDAKKLKKEHNIPLSEAQNIIAKKETHFKNWNSMMKAINNSGEVIGRFAYHDMQFNKHFLSVYKNKPIILFDAPPGTGKSLWVTQLILNSNKNNILYFSLSSLENCFSNFYDLIKTKKELKISEFIFKHDSKIFDLTYKHDLINGEITQKISKKYDLVIIDEYQRLSYGGKYLKDIIKKCSELNIPILIMTQIMNNSNGWYIIQNYTSQSFSTNRIFNDSPVSNNIKADSNVTKEGVSGVIHSSYVDSNFFVSSFSNKKHN